MGCEIPILPRPWIRPLAELKQEIDSELRREKVAHRNRRLRAGEEQALLTTSIGRLYRVIVAAVDTGCRQGELLALRWQEVNLDRRELRILAETAKDNEDRILPISARLLAVLEMARHDSTGNVLAPPRRMCSGQRPESEPRVLRQLGGRSVAKLRFMTFAFTTSDTKLAVDS